MIAILVAAIAGPAIRYAFLRPGRGISRWLWKHMPEGRIKRLLLKPVRKDDPDTWPKLPPGA